ERGLRWGALASDGGRAIESAVRAVDPHGVHGRDVWHALHRCGQAQARLERHLAQREQQTAAVARQVARLAAGQGPRGRRPRTDAAAHAAEVAAARRAAAGLRYLTGQFRALLEVAAVTG